MSITSFRGKYHFLSNFSRHPPFLYEGIICTFVEQAFQAMKTLDPSWRERIIYAHTPNQAKSLGRRAPLRPDWEDLKIPVMRELLTLKFKDPGLRAQLDATKGIELIEGNTWGDRFWGQDPVGTGENWLGRLLMEIRDAPR